MLGWPTLTGAVTYINILHFTHRRRWILGWPTLKGAVTYINILHFTHRRRWILGWPTLKGAVTYINILHFTHRRRWMLGWPAITGVVFSEFPPFTPTWQSAVTPCAAGDMSHCFAIMRFSCAHPFILSSHEHPTLLPCCVSVTLLLSDDPKCKLCSTCVTHPLVWWLSIRHASVLTYIMLKCVFNFVLFWTKNCICFELNWLGRWPA